MFGLVLIVLLILGFWLAFKYDQAQNTPPETYHGRHRSEDIREQQPKTWKPDSPVRKIIASWENTQTLPVVR